MRFETPRMELLVELLDEITTVINSGEIDEDEDGFGPLKPL